MRLSAACLGVGAALFAASASAWAEPPPQLSVEQLQRQLAAPETPPDQPGPGAPAAPGSCEAQNAVTGPDGSCQPRIGRKRGFSLASPGAKAAAAGPKPTSTAATPIAAPPRASPGRTGRKLAAVRALAAQPAQPGHGHDLLITFANDSAVLTDQAKANARVLAEALKTPALQGARLAIDGHTNAVGSREKNLDLSKRRAQALVEYLTTLGIDPSRFDVNGYGFDRPVNARNPRSPSNRRVEARRLG